MQLLERNWELMITRDNAELVIAIAILFITIIAIAETIDRWNGR
jgi:hypothetical protein